MSNESSKQQRPSVPSAPPPFNAAIGRNSNLQRSPSHSYMTSTSFSTMQRNQFSFSGPGALSNTTANNNNSTNPTNNQAIPQVAPTQKKLPTAQSLGVKFADTNKTDISDEDLQSWSRVRKHVVTEILTTEQSYIESLNLMMKAYHDPFVIDHKSNTGLSDKKIGILFPKITVILSIGTSFLEALKPFVENWDIKEEIAPVFDKYSKMFRTYRDFASQHQQAITPLLAKLNSRSQWTSFQEKQMRALNCLDLSSYMIMPIQRLPRYKLMLEVLISKTLSTDPQAQALLNALEIVSEVATSVNEATRAAQQVQHYMAVQQMFDQHDELVHLWRKLVAEYPCQIARIWTPNQPQKDDTKKDNSKEKKEKKHKYVGCEATLYVFTDCVYVGIKVKERVAKYNETKVNPVPYPVFGGDCQYKFSLVTLGRHALSTIGAPNGYRTGDYVYHNSLILSGPFHALCLTFDSKTITDTISNLLMDQLEALEGMRKLPDITTTQYHDVPTNNNWKEYLCCDRCSHALFVSHKEGNLHLFQPNYSHIICNQCNGIICANCVFDKQSHYQKVSAAGTAAQGSATALVGLSSYAKQAMIPGMSNEPVHNTRQLVNYSQGNTHISKGFGVSQAQGRWCNACNKNPPQGSSVNGPSTSSLLGDLATPSTTSPLNGTLTPQDSVLAAALQAQAQISSNAMAAEFRTSFVALPPPPPELDTTTTSPSSNFVPALSARGPPPGPAAAVQSFGPSRTMPPPPPSSTYVDYSSTPSSTLNALPTPAQLPPPLNTSATNLDDPEVDISKLSPRSQCRVMRRKNTATARGSTTGTLPPPRPTPGPPSIPGAMPPPPPEDELPPPPPSDSTSTNEFTITEFPLTASASSEVSSVSHSILGSIQLPTQQPPPPQQPQPQPRSATVHRSNDVLSPNRPKPPADLDSPRQAAPEHGGAFPSLHIATPSSPAPPATPVTGARLPPPTPTLAAATPSASSASSGFRPPTFRAPSTGKLPPPFAPQ